MEKKNDKAGYSRRLKVSTTLEINLKSPRYQGDINIDVLLAIFPFLSPHEQAGLSGRFSQAVNLSGIGQTLSAVYWVVQTTRISANKVCSEP